jgi:chromate transport protein ChrA
MTPAEVAWFYDGNILLLVLNLPLVGILSRILYVPAPGPGALLTTLIGWKTAGFTGAVIASLALFVPSSLLSYGATLAAAALAIFPTRPKLNPLLVLVAAGLVYAVAGSIF